MSDRDDYEDAGRGRIGRLAKVVALTVVILGLLVLALMLAGGSGGGEHGPSRHWAPADVGQSSYGGPSLPIREGAR